mmetsp:Transcript_33183/g.92994  ORF Transcript_33183/g.92994 Transcript_33183/m.92994 type:complete len:625 (+) Transcript_33183:27-1901(+)
MGLVGVIGRLTCIGVLSITSRIGSRSAWGALLQAVLVVAEAECVVKWVGEALTAPPELDQLLFLIVYIPYTGLMGLVYVLVGLDTATLAFLIATWILLAVWVAYRFVLEMGFSSWRGPFPWPVVGQLPHAIASYDRIRDLEVAVTRQYGKTVCYKLGTEYDIWTIDHRDIEHVLANSHCYEQGKIRKWVFTELLGNGIFNTDGAAWKSQRQAMTGEFGSVNFRKFMLEYAGDQVLHAVAVMEKRGCEPFDLQDIFFRYTLDSFSQMAFGVDVGSLREDEAPAFGKAFDLATELVPGRFFNPFWEIERLLNIGSERVLRDSIAVVDDYIYGVIAERAGDANIGQRNDLLSRFIRLARTDGTDHVNTKYLRDLVVNALLAGRDTTASALSWCAYLLSQHTLVVERILQEQREILGELVPGEIRLPNFDQLKRMDYLHSVVTETLRLYPPVPIDMKVYTGETTDSLPSGIPVRTGVAVSYLPYAMGRSNEYYDDPDTFRPERWLTSEGRFRRPSQYRFPVFQGGPRTCLGQDLAYLEAKVMLCGLVQRFEIELACSPKGVQCPRQARPYDARTRGVTCGSQAADSAMKKCSPALPMLYKGEKLKMKFVLVTLTLFLFSLFQGTFTQG